MEILLLIFIFCVIVFFGLMVILSDNPENRAFLVALLIAVSVAFGFYIHYVINFINSVKF